MGEPFPGCIKLNRGLNCSTHWRDQRHFESHNSSAWNHFFNRLIKTLNLICLHMFSTPRLGICSVLAAGSGHQACPFHFSAGTSPFSTDLSPGVLSPRVPGWGWGEGRLLQPKLCSGGITPIPWAWLAVRAGSVLRSMASGSWVILALRGHSPSWLFSPALGLPLPSARLFPALPSACCVPDPSVLLGGAVTRVGSDLAGPSCPWGKRTCPSWALGTPGVGAQALRAAVQAPLGSQPWQSPKTCFAPPLGMLLRLQMVLPAEHRERPSKKSLHCLLTPICSL